MPCTPVVTLGVAFLLALTFNLSGCGSSYSGTTLQTIDIAPISPNIAVGRTVQFTATGHYSDNTTADLTKQSNWSSSVTTVATVDNIGTTSGLAHGIGAGQSNIIVSFAQGSSSVNASTDATGGAGRIVRTHPVHDAELCPAHCITPRYRLHGPTASAY